MHFISWCSKIARQVGNACSRVPGARRASKRSPLLIKKGRKGKGKKRKPTSRWLAVLLMGSYVQRWQVAQDGSHTPNNRLTETCRINTERFYITRLRCSACQSQIPTVTDDQCSRLIGLITHSCVWSPDIFSRLKFAITTAMITSSFHLYSRSSKSLSFNVSFHSRVKMSSINWSAPNMWVFIAQLVEQRGDSRRRRHGFKSRWSAEILFRAKICSCLNCNYNCDDHIFISSVFPQFKITFNQYPTSVLRKAKGFHSWWENSKVAEQGELTIRYLQQESLDVFF